MAPSSISRVVVLPAPLGPNRPIRAPAGTAQIQVIDRRLTFEGLDEAAGVDTRDEDMDVILAALPGRWVRISSQASGIRRLGAAKWSAN